MQNGTHEIRADNVEPVLVQREIFGLEAMPVRFRTTKHIFNPEKYPHINTQGLSSINASGSGGWTVENFPRTIEYLRSALGAKNIVVIDLRKESHCYINKLPYLWFATPEGAPVRQNGAKDAAPVRQNGVKKNTAYDWYNDEKTGEQIIQDESERAALLAAEGKTTIWQIIASPFTHEIVDPSKKNLIKIEEIVTEADLVQQAHVETGVPVHENGVKYIRLPVTDHNGPAIEIIDQFVHVVQTHKDKWLHIHCLGGKGRTTTFLTLLDIIHNAKNLDLVSIGQRQTALCNGERNLFDPTSGTPWQVPIAQERLENLKKFYQYCKENNDGFATKFSTWLKSNVST